MKRTILVPIKSDDRIDVIGSCVERVAQPGMKVVFLMRFPVEDSHRILTLCALMDEGVPDAAAASMEIAETFSWQESMQRAESKLAGPVEALRSRGVDAVVAVYTGSLRKAVRNQSLDGDVQWVLSPARFWNRVVCLLTGTASVLDLFSRPSFSPMMLIKLRTFA